MLIPLITCISPISLLWRFSDLCQQQYPLSCHCNYGCSQGRSTKFWALCSQLQWTLHLYDSNMEKQKSNYLWALVTQSHVTPPLDTPGYPPPLRTCISPISLP